MSKLVVLFNMFIGRLGVLTFGIDVLSGLNMNTGIIMDSGSGPMVMKTGSLMNMAI